MQREKKKGGKKGVPGKRERTDTSYIKFYPLWEKEGKKS